MDSIVLVTGAARGLGLEMCRQLLSEGRTVVACPRKAGEPDLERLAEGSGHKLHIVPIDVGDEDSIREGAGRIEGLVDRIDILINNAGVYPKIGTVASGIDSDEMIRAFRVNTLGPMHVVTAFLPLLRKGKDRKLAQITSKMGSIDDNTSGGSYAYRITKAALNMAVKNLAHEFGPEGFIALTLHPGWVQTRMGTGAAPLPIEPGVADILKTIREATGSDNGAFIGPGQERIPW
jgi:NAD(P)-dependent dehydrogenase (short-subunit alcohol dehydrogenase family)